MELLRDPVVDEEGNLLYPYTPSLFSSVPVNTDIMLVCQVAYFGHMPRVYLTYQGVIIPTTQTSQVGYSHPHTPCPTPSTPSPTAYTSYTPLPRTPPLYPYTSLYTSCFQNTSTITATYYIASVMFEDEGSFACYADDGDFITRDFIRLTVYGRET
jgi:hypothetical protein